MSARAERGRRWARWGVIVACIPPAIQVLFAPAHQDMANRIALALVQFGVGLVVLGGGAFLIGWLTGKDASEASGGLADTAGSQSQDYRSARSAEDQAGAAPGLAQAALGVEVPLFDETVEGTPRGNPYRSKPASVMNEPAVIGIPIDAKKGGASPSDEALWAEALSEFESSARRRGLWAKAFAQAGGDESLAKAAYLRDRFAELVKEKAALSEAAEVARQEDAARKAKVRETLRLAAIIRGDPFASVAQRARLIEALGGQVRWEGGFFGDACSVRLGENERSFAHKQHFKKWVDSEIIPSLLKDLSTDELFPK